MKDSPTNGSGRIEGEAEHGPFTLFHMRGRNQPKQDAAEFAARLAAALDAAPLQAKVPDSHGRKSWLAKSLGVSPTSAGGYLNGTNMPVATRIEELADLCQVRLEWLQFGRGEMRESQSASEHLTESVREGSRTKVTPENNSPSVRPESLITSLHLALTAIAKLEYELPPIDLVTRIVEVSAEMLDNGMPLAEVVSMIDALARRMIGPPGGDNDASHARGARS